MMILAGKDCLKCQYLELNDPKNFKVKCTIKNKEYIWGQKISCEGRKKK